MLKIFKSKDLFLIVGRVITLGITVGLPESLHLVLQLVCQPEVWDLTLYDGFGLYVWHSDWLRNRKLIKKVYNIPIVLYQMMEKSVRTEVLICDGNIRTNIQT